MKASIAKSLLACCALVIGAPAFGGNPLPMERRIQPIPRMPSIDKKALAAAFRVTQVKFELVTVNNQQHLAVGVIFNKNINAATVQPNVNIRLLRRNANGFWVDASTQGNTVRVRPDFITWLSGAPVESDGLYKMHLRGTIKSSDGTYLDCNGDGQGEGGALPPYESQTYRAPHLSQTIELVPREN